MNKLSQAIESREVQVSWERVNKWSGCGEHRLFRVKGVKLVEVLRYILRHTNTREVELDWKDSTGSFGNQVFSNRIELKASLSYYGLSGRAISPRNGWNSDHTPRARDFQRAKLYSFENKQLKVFQSEAKSLGYLNVLGYKIWDYVGMPGAHYPVVRISEKKGGAHFSPLHNEIALGRKCANRPIFIHEMTHAIVRGVERFNNKPPSYLAHGPEFCGLYFHLLEKFREEPDLCDLSKEDMLKLFEEKKGKANFTLVDKLIKQKEKCDE